MKLARLIHGLDARVIAGSDDVEILGVTMDSRAVKPGFVFVAAGGALATSRHGSSFIDAAVAAGAVAIVKDDDAAARMPLETGAASATVLVVDNARRFAARAVERLLGSPSASLRVVGVTGTNGKTTVSFLTSSLLSALGRKSAVLGTLGFGDRRALRPLAHTTPEAEVLSHAMRDLVREGFDSVVMEVSSHALQLARADGIQFAAAAFTNLTQDHLDFHATLGAYLDAKKRLFNDLLSPDAVAILPAAVVVVDGVTLRRENGKVMTWGVNDGDVRAENAVVGAGGVSFDLCVGDERHPVKSPLMGAHNVENLVVAAGIALTLGHAPVDVARALGAALGAPGRLERVSNHGGEPMVLVDYAHTPDALTRSIAAARAVTRGRLIVVFGCGGDRDKKKRPLMGRIAAADADVVILTSDNPRSEDVGDIIKDIRDGITVENRAHVMEQADRAAAIAEAIMGASVDDVVLLAGKGHETTLTTKLGVFPFDDRVEARRVLDARRGSAS